VGVLTTGFDAPNVDALICLRPTLSPGLWVQIVGRGARLAPNKTDCLVCDFTDNTHRHGPVDLIDVDGDGNCKTSPYRVCPMCGELIEPRQKACSCGYSFERECYKCHSLFDRDLAACPDCGAFVRVPDRSPKHNETTSDDDILSDDGKYIRHEAIEYMTVGRHQKDGKPDSMKVSYFVSMSGKPYQEWLCFDHGGFATQKAKAKWSSLGGMLPEPSSTNEAMDRRDELQTPSQITVVKEGKYWRVQNIELGVIEQQDNDSGLGQLDEWAFMLRSTDDDVPF